MFEWLCYLDFKANTLTTMFVVETRYAMSEETNVSPGAVG